MTSLQLPFWMEEMVAEPSPLSPVAAALPPPTTSLHAEDFMLFDDNFAADFLIADNDDKLITFNTSNDQHFELDQSMNNTESTAWSSESSTTIVSQPKNTDELLFEFETVCNAVGVTPPPSPPTENLFEGVPIYYVVTEEVASTSTQSLLDSIAASIVADEENSTNFIDELVRSHSTELPDLDYDFDDDGAMSFISESSSSGKSPQSPQSDSGLSPRSDSGSSFAGFSMNDDDGNTDDDEWVPKIAPDSKLKKTSSAAKPEKRQKRAYGRAPEEKKVRKKEQNKNAATRYRQKKRQQLEEILREEEGLKVVYRSLQTQYDDVKREINYLKKLMREIMIAKGVKI